jgi:hypothetical protein
MRLDSIIGMSGRFTLEAENRGKICRKIIFPEVSFRTRMYKKLIRQSNSNSKICKHIIDSQVINEHKFPCIFAEKHNEAWKV